MVIYGTKLVDDWNWPHDVFPESLREDDVMAETSKGKKFVKVKGYSRIVDGKTVKVRPADRSTPRTSTGKKKK